MFFLLSDLFFLEIERYDREIEVLEVEQLFLDVSPPVGSRQQGKVQGGSFEIKKNLAAEAVRVRYWAENANHDSEKRPDGEFAAFRDFRASEALIFLLKGV